MGDMKCPFCQRKLEEETFSRGRVFVSCNNPNCLISDWGGCSKQIITELIRTRKALDVAVDALKSAHDYYEYCIQRDKEYGSDDINWDCIAMNMDNDIFKALEQITALEQKDK